MAVMQSKEDMVTNFDAESFANSSFSDQWPNRIDDWHSLFFIDSFSEIFGGGYIQGKSLLDVGTGPNIYSVISACKHFDNIYLSDLIPQNRKYLQRWIQEDEGCHDWSNIMKHIVYRENPRENWEDRRAELRQKIKAVLSCDVSQVNPLNPNFFPQFDAITSAKCLETASYDLDSYQTFSSNVASLLKPGGWMVLAACLGYQSWCSGYKAAPTMLEDIQKTWTELGFEVDTLKKYILTAAEKETLLAHKCDREKETIQGVCVMAAQKKSTELVVGAQQMW